MTERLTDLVAEGRRLLAVTTPSNLVTCPRDYLGRLVAAVADLDPPSMRPLASEPMEVAIYLDALLDGATQESTGGDAAEHIVNVLGWRPPARVIETVEEADQVRSSTVVRTWRGWIAECTGAPCWVLVGDKHPFMTRALDFPLTVLHESEEAARD